MSEANLNSTALPVTVGQEATVQVAKPQPQGTVEIEISLPGPWVLRLQNLASRFGRPESDVASVLFCKSISLGLTLAEYDHLQELSQSHNVNAISIPKMEVKDQI